MSMKYAMCPRHGGMAEVYPGLGICAVCYQKEKYWERRTKATKTDPAVAMKEIATGLKALRRLLDAGLLTPLKYASVAEELINVSNELHRSLLMDQEIQISDMAQEETITGLLKREIVWADSPEEAERLLKERKAPRLIESTDKPKEQPESDKDDGDSPVAA